MKFRLCDETMATCPQYGNRIGMSYWAYLLGESFTSAATGTLFGFFILILVAGKYLLPLGILATVASLLCMVVALLPTPKQ